MCTVTFVPTKSGVHLTSNRDERMTRKPALEPDLHEFTTGSILFPRDGEAGGTWVTLHANGQAMILLNGAFEAHTHRPPYRKSRGLVLLDLADTLDPLAAFQETDLNGIEPFTVIMYRQGALHDCRWDGLHKHLLRPDPTAPQIWSSCTLYDEGMHRNRTAWFGGFLENEPDPDTHGILHFHMHAGDGNTYHDLLMNRKGELGTVSVTTLRITEGSGIMQYLDVRNGSTSTREIPFDQTTA